MASPHNPHYQESPNAETEPLIQVGWWIPDEFMPERMSKRTWEEARLSTLWTVEDDGGFAPEWEARVVPVYIKAGVLS